MPRQVNSLSSSSSSSSSTKLSTTYANVWTRAFWCVLEILRILC